MHTHAEDFGQFMFGGVSLHPGHPMMMDTIGEDEADVYSRIHSPQYFMSTPDTPDSCRPGGIAEQNIDAEVGCVWSSALQWETQIQHSPWPIDQG